MKIPPTSHAAVLTRLVLQKLLTNPAVTYMRKDYRAILDKAFLSHDILEDRDGFDFVFVVPDESSYYASICTVGFKWVEVQKDVKDSEGNLWTLAKLHWNMSTGASYNNTAEQLKVRGETVARMAEFVEEITKMIPGPVSCMTHDNDARIAKEELERYTAACETIRSIVNANKLRHEMREGSVRKYASYSHERNLFPKDLKPGNYKVWWDDGSKRRPNKKYYVLRVPEGSYASWTFYRTDKATWDRV